MHYTRSHRDFKDFYHGLLGVLVGSTRLVYRGLIGTLEFARAIPALVLVIVLVAMDFRGEGARLACITVAIGFIMAEATATGMRSIRRESIEVLWLMRLGAWRTFWRASFVPLLLQSLLPAIRLGIGVALIVSLAVEFILVPEKGLGMLLNIHLGKASLAGALALTLVAGVIGWIGNLFVLLLTEGLWWSLMGRPFASPDQVPI